MFPVFTNPLGSRNESFASICTLYCLSASAADALLGSVTPLVMTPPLGTLEDDGKTAFRLTRSAHDLGAGFDGGDGAGVASSADPSPPLALGFCSSITGVDISEGVDFRSDASATAGDESLGLLKPGRLGMAIAVRVSRRVCCGGCGAGLGNESSG